MISNGKIPDEYNHYWERKYTNDLEVAKYEMDTFGFCRIKGLMEKEELEDIKNTFDQIKKNDYSLEETDICLGQMRDDGTAFISNIADGSPLLRELAFRPKVIELLNVLMNWEFKLNHSNAIMSNAGSTYPHMGAYPIHNKAFFHSRGNAILSSLTKLVIPITNNDKNDGGLAAIRGSHKSNFPIPYPKRSLEEHNLLEHIPIEIGDAILFTEALTHGSLKNISGNTRRILFFCYSMINIPEWSTQGLKISEEFCEKVSKENKKYLRQ